MTLAGWAAGLQGGLGSGAVIQTICIPCSTLITEVAASERQSQPYEGVKVRLGCLLNERVRRQADLSNKVGVGEHARCGPVDLVPSLPVCMSVLGLTAVQRSSFVLWYRPGLLWVTQQRVPTAAGLQVSTAHAHVQHDMVLRLTLQ